MKFDLYAALANLRSEGGGRATPATCATQTPDSGPHVAQVARVARRTASDAGIDRQPVPADACRTSRTCRTGQALHPESPGARRLAALPSHPPTCAICGAADWLVAMSEGQPRKHYHVDCYVDQFGPLEGGKA